jgi:hypothetical protein
MQLLQRFLLDNINIIMDFQLLVEQELYEAVKKCTGPTKKNFKQPQR